ncbi:MAG: hypothetical protein ACRDPA_17870, partial [Solirubrobacteraceae bacterium]
MTPGPALTARPKLFAALEMLFDVRFVPLTPGVSHVGLIAIGDAPEACASAAIPMIAFADAQIDPRSLGNVVLERADAVDRRLHGVTLWGQLPSPDLAPDPTREDVLAADGRHARWTSSRGPVKSYRVAGALPELRPGEILRYSLMSEYSISIVTLVHFLRA